MDLKFIDREKEIWRLGNVLSDPPNYILVVYGPKSSGKSTLMMRIARAFQDNSFVYYDMRARHPKKIEDVLATERPGLVKRFRRMFRKKKFDDGIEIRRSEMKAIRKGEEDAFKPLLPVLRRMNKPALILDEIQALQFGELSKESISSVLNFLVTITKRLHLAHAIIVTSDCLFVHEVMHLAALEEAAEFMFIGDLPENAVKAWLENEGLGKEERNRIFEMVGGRPYDLWVVLQHWRNEKNLDILDQTVQRKAERIKFLLSMLPDKEKRRYLKDLKEMLYLGKLKGVRPDFLDWVIKNEIAFFDPVTGNIFPISTAMKNALESIFQ
ncbi:MAG: AAA family ATPase [Candidatus Altiarchaeota archaeon]|nr:AAA family ATPase [Candidatus Altiarchaeota archaeon]